MTVSSGSNFVAGATGFVGREVVRQLCVRGAKVIAHVRPDSSKLADWTAKFRELGASVDSSPWEASKLGAAMANVDRVYILIGTTRGKAKQDKVDGNIYEAVDLGLTKIAVAAAKIAGKPRLIYLSSVGASPTASSAYLKARGQAEQVVRDSGLPWVMARPSLIVGDRDETRVGEAVGSVVGDGLLAVVGLFGGKKVRAKYRSTSADVLASALIRLGEGPEHDRIADGAELR